MDTRFVDSDGVRIAYSVEGEGEAIVFLHGGGDTKEAWEKHGYWRAIISAMPNWGSVGVEDTKCPVMILYGERDEGVHTQLERFEKETVYYGVPIYRMEELGHYDQFTDSGTNLPYIKRLLTLKDS